MLLPNHAGWPAKVTRIGLAKSGTLIVETKQGIKIADAELFSWIPADASQVVAWSQPIAIPEQLASELDALYPSAFITMEKLLLDLHSLRLLEPLGPWLLDLAAVAVAIAIMSLSGFMMWRRNGKKRG